MVSDDPIGGTVGRVARREHGVRDEREIRVGERPREESAFRWSP
jgi:hypothetical protein